MDTLPLIVPGLCAETAAYHGGTTSGGLASGPGIWDGQYRPAPVTNGDAAAWAFIALLIVITTALIMVIRALRMRPPGLTPEQQLIDEVHRNESDYAEGRMKGEPPASRLPWERDADWWRQP
jgi:hypothetical protein